MNIIVRSWRALVHGRKFVKRGKRTQFLGAHLYVDGHVEIGDYVRLRDFCIMRTRKNGKIIFGNRCGCSWYCIFEANDRIEIGDYTGIGEFTVIRDTNHHVIGTDEHWKLTPHIAEPIVIGQSCLIGSRCYIGPGVTIGNGAVLAPGCYVTNKTIGPLEIWAGSPARKVGHRTENVPGPLLKRHQELMAQFGIREDRRGYKGGFRDLEAADAEDDD